MLRTLNIFTPLVKGKDLNLNKCNPRYWKYICQSFCSSTETENDSLHYDFVISGGGMVGFAAGCALGQSKRLEGRKILVLEKQSERAWSLPEEHSNRVCALNPQSKSFFSNLGAWDIIKDYRAQPVKKMQVWESCSEALITFEDEVTGDNLAHIVENDVILHSLKERLPENVEVWYGSHISGYELPSSNENKPIITLSDGKKITTDLLIGADGLHSGVRKAMKSRSLSWEYDQMGIVATLHLSEEQSNFTAWQKFLSTGPIALLPLSSTRSSLVWSTTKQKAAALMSLSENDFLDALNNSLWRDEGVAPLIKTVHEQWQNILQAVAPSSQRSLLGPGSRQLPPSISGIAPKSRASFPLGLLHAARYVGPHVALIGDAAHRVHPLAGQGVNLGFGDVVCLLETLEKAILLGCDIGNEEVLQKYETLRQRHNVASMAAIDTLYRLYSTSFAPLVLIRSLGLSTVDAFTPIKQRIMNHASS